MSLPQAAALTPTLFLGDHLEIKHRLAPDANKAAQWVKQGETVLVSSPDTAYRAMLLLGVDDDEAFDRAQRAVFGVPTDVDLPVVAS